MWYSGLAPNCHHFKEFITHLAYCRHGLTTADPDSIESFFDLYNKTMLDSAASLHHFFRELHDLYSTNLFEVPHIKSLLEVNFSHFRKKWPKATLILPLNSTHTSSI